MTNKIIAYFSSTKSHNFFYKQFGRISLFILHKIFYPMKFLILITNCIILYEVCKENLDDHKLPGAEMFKNLLMYIGNKVMHEVF